MRRSWTVAFLTLSAIALLLSSGLTAGLAQEGQTQTQSQEKGLTLSTPYPAQVIQADETVTLSLTVRNRGLPSQIVRLDVKEAPEGWKASFLGGGRIVKAVYVETDDSVSVSLKLEPPKDVQPGTYRFVVTAQGEGIQAELPIELTVEEKLPPKLKLDVELPTLKGSPTTTFRYRATLENEGDEDLLVSLDADAPEGFEVTFKLRFGSEEVTSLPLKAGESKSLDIEVKPPRQAPAGEYKVKVRAQAGEARAALTLTAMVTGRPDITVTTPDGRLSGQAYAGRETQLKIVVRNAGSAPAKNIRMSAFEPTGWTVEFEPETIPEIRPDSEAEVTAKVKPSEKAVAGDYMVTIRANGDEGASDSVEIRLTVLTSTLWGVVGIALIAVALGVVMLAVSRFGRR
jgi:uncharacterized membrane protein